MSVTPAESIAAPRKLSREEMELCDIAVRYPMFRIVKRSVGKYGYLSYFDVYMFLVADTAFGAVTGEWHHVTTHDTEHKAFRATRAYSLVEQIATGTNEL